MREPELVDIACEVRRETEKGIAIWDGEQMEDGREKWTWLPKAQVEINNDGTITLPVWLAQEKELI